MARHFEQPRAMQLRYLTRAGKATDRGSLIVFPLPLDLISGFIGRRPSSSGRPVVAPSPSVSPPGLAGGA